jgi:hypothetical protein
MKNNKVLIVEEEPIIAADLEDRLIDMGCYVLPAHFRYGGRKHTAPGNECIF